MRSIIIAIVAVAGIIAGSGIANAEPVQITTPSVVARLDYCPDDIPVYIDDETGILYGDQNRDGILSGIDCDWK